MLQACGLAFHEVGRAAVQGAHGRDDIAYALRRGIGCQLFVDDAPGLRVRASAGRDVGIGGRERLAQALDIDQIHALGRSGGIVDIARQGEIDEHELAAGGNVGGLDGEFIGAGGGDGQVDVGKGGGTLGKVHDAGGNARLLGVAGQALGALTGAVGQHQLLDPQPAGVGGGERCHSARAEDQRGLAGQVLGV